ncbi:MAG TPA: hypothetical protein VGQ28_18415 [Thermoanaerobaculia bacterium]|nr:hypothetical protein [Thermoanaerobaculia bacterium]
MSSSGSQRALPNLAWANVTLHGVGLTLAWFGMRPGSIAAPLADRMAYLAARPAGWIGGWGIWMICTVLLVSFMAVLRSRLPAPSPAADLALAFTSAGMAVDLLCDVIQMQALPMAAAGQGQVNLFLALERIAFTGGATVANGLYTAGIVLMTFCLRPITGMPARLAGWATGLSGAVMVLSGLVLSPALLVASTGPTIGFYSLWTVLVARDLQQDRP